MNEVIKAIEARRSIRAYKQEKPPKSDIEAVIEAGKLACGGMSLKNRHFIGILKEETLKEVNEATRQAFLKLELSEDAAPFYVNMKAKAKDADAEFLYNAPALIIVSVNDDDEFAEANGSVSVENMMLAAVSLGLDTCWLNQLTRMQKSQAVQEIKKSIGIPADHRIICTLAIGYAAADAAPVRAAFKKSTSEIIE